MWIYSHKYMRRVDMSLEANHIETIDLLTREILGFTQIKDKK